MGRIMLIFFMGLCLYLGTEYIRGMYEFLCDYWIVIPWLGVVGILGCMSLIALVVVFNLPEFNALVQGAARQAIHP